MEDFVGFIVGREIECLEYNLLLYANPITKSIIRDLVDRTLSYEREVKEEDIDSWIATIENRSYKYLNRSLYSVENNIITPLKKWNEVPEYFLCIHFSLYGASSDITGTKLFEKISAYALKNFINGDVYILGFPANKNLNEYLDELSYLFHEHRGMQANNDYKDDGVDVIGYKKFNDNRSSNLYVLQQCAAGKHWSKKKQIPLERWTKYIYWYSKNIIESISTVDYVDLKEFGKQVSTYGMLFDRLRIYNSLYNKDIETGLRSEVLEWCNSTFN
ncbi:hypothetical protein [Mesoflavibacter zeaxanthinifaciens]|uniref:hypothetical protein n=1 Tax=Mesoflavibacter zeaxanthinifaciens TaxID=393060 RepID=UPI0003F7B9E4|nr:hypothetical protein [Mesoflavibacter zeaxanthinifaciens]